MYHIYTYPAIDSHLSFFIEGGIRDNAGGIMVFGEYIDVFLLSEVLEL